MKRALLAATLLAAPCAIGAAAHAQPITGLYIGLGGGGNLLMNEALGPSSARVGQAGHNLKFDLGEVAVGSIGWGFGNGFRVEVEGNYRNNDLHQYTAANTPTSAGGQERNYGAMVNLLFDLDVRSRWIYPYFGVGGGWAHTRADNLSAVGVNPPAVANIVGNSDNFAYQGIFGAAFPIPWVPGLSLTAEYRFYGIPNPGGFSRTITQPEPYPTGPVRTSAPKADINQDLNHSVLIGLRYAFYTAPPPPPAAPAPVAAPAPAPAPARSYLVFFDWDRADLTGRARQVIAEAARNVARVQVTRIEVNGYTDTSGTPQYNQGLSVRRARSVMAELVRDGVPATEIDIQGFGETHLLVATGPGVREPQNRRVEIIIR